MTKESEDFVVCDRVKWCWAEAFIHFNRNHRATNQLACFQVCQFHVLPFYLFVESFVGLIIMIVVVLFYYFFHLCLMCLKFLFVWHIPWPKEYIYYSHFEHIGRHSTSNSLANPNISLRQNITSISRYSGFQFSLFPSVAFNCLHLWMCNKLMWPFNFVSLFLSRAEPSQFNRIKQLLCGLPTFLAAFCQHHVSCNRREILNPNKKRIQWSCRFDHTQFGDSGKLTERFGFVLD